MSETADSVLNAVLARVRDPGGLLHSRDLCKDLLTRLQWLYCNQAKLVVVEQDFTVQPRLQIYTLDEVLDDGLGHAGGIQLLEVRQNNRHLERTTLTILRALDPRWPLAVAGRLECFVQLGYTHVLIWPAIDYQSVVSVTATKLTTPTEQLGANDPLDIPPQTIPKLEKLLELILLLRQKDLLAFNALLAQLAGGTVKDGQTAAAPEATQTQA